MHESVVTLQHLLADERDAVRVMAETLAHADTHHVALANRASLEEEIRARTKRCDNLDGLIGDYVAAERDGMAASAAFKLVLVQYAAATMVEAAQDGGTR
jgi:hypothetical protein